MLTSLRTESKLVSEFAPRLVANEENESIRKNNNNNNYKPFFNFNTISGLLIDFNANKYITLSLRTNYILTILYT